MTSEELRERSVRIRKLADAYSEDLPLDCPYEVINVLKCLRSAALEMHNASIWLQRHNDNERKAERAH